MDDIYKEFDDGVVFNYGRHRYGIDLLPISICFMIGFLIVGVLAK